MKTHPFVILATATLSLLACASPTTTDKSPATTNNNPVTTNNNPVTDATNPFAAYHDGTWDKPVAWAGATGKVGASSRTVTRFDQSPGTTSYYTFTTGAGVTSVLFQISGSTPAHGGLGANDYYRFTLTGPGGLNNTYIANGNFASDRVSPLFRNLSPSTAYGFTMENTADADTTFNLSIAPNPADLSDGTAANPVSLTLGQAYPGKVTLYFSPSAPSYSYYKFTLTAASKVKVSYTLPEINSTLSAFDFQTSTNILDSESSGATNSLTSSTVLAAGVYYLQVSPSLQRDSRALYDIKVETVAP